ncbi:MAG: hypothetical protein WC201_05375 [Bacilli bacterium]
MKKYALWTFLSLFLIGCSPIRSQYAIPLMNNIDLKINDEQSLTENLSATQLLNLTASNASYALFVYSNTCNYCHDAQVSIQSFIKDYHYVIYSLEYTSVGYQSLNTAYPEIFTNGLSTPSLLIINNQILTYSFDYNVLLSYTSFKPVAKQHFYQCSIATFTQEASMNSFFSENEETLVFIYDDFHRESLHLFYDIVYPAAIESSTMRTAFLNKNRFETSVFDQLCTTLTIASSEDSIAVFCCSDEQIKTTNYLLDDGLELKSLVNQYLCQ